jgi:hypothetical protein
VKTVLFTYYSNPVQDIFLENIESLLKNSACEYDEISICSQIDIPPGIIKSLSKYGQVNRFFPDHNSQKTKRASRVDQSYRINPFMLTALSYRNCRVTVFDPQLFIINELPTNSQFGFFYKDHKGLLSSQLFTIINSDATSNLLLNGLAGLDFTDPSIISKFAFIISNGVPFSSFEIHEDSFIFTDPSDFDTINVDKLIALDFSGSATSSNVHKQMWAIRSEHLPKISTLTKLKKVVKDSIASQVITIAAKTIDSSILGNNKSNQTILFKYTSRSRPDLFYRGLVSIINNCVSPNYLVLCSLDDNDPTLDQYLEYIKSLENPKISVVLGSSKNKIDAINRDLNYYEKSWDILINMSDDMVFVERGFDNIIRNAFDSNLDQFIHFNDGNQRSNLCSMTIEGKEYYRRFNYIYHPSYISLWCDVEAQEVAKLLGKYKYMGDSVVLFKHLHPAFGLAQMDSQYSITESQSLWSADHVTFTNRQANRFAEIDRIEIGEAIKNHPTLSILILSIHSRKTMFDSLFAEFMAQAAEFNGECEILYDIDNGEKTKGLKRNDLLMRATGKYVAFFDDDDWPSNDYVKSILFAVQSNPDCCSLLGEMTTNGINPEIFEHSLSYTEWRTASTGRVKYERTPNHLNAIRSTIAKSIKFPEINYGEDHEWSKSLTESGLLKTESKIQNVIYYYRYQTK